MATKQEQREDLERAQWILNRQRDHYANGGLLLISTDYGSGLTDYLRVNTVITEPDRQLKLSLTWAIAQVFGYKLRERVGYWHLAISGYGYSKADEIARGLAHYYELDRIIYDEL